EDRPGLESEGVVHTVRGVVLHGEVQERDLAATADATHECTNELRRESSPALIRVGADRADLRVARWVHALAGHRDQRAPVAHAQIGAELDRAPGERAGPGAF